MRYVVLDDDTGEVLAASRDLNEVLAAIGGGAEGTSATSEPEVHTKWDFPSLDEMSVAGRAGWKVESHAALHDEGGGVTVRLYRSREEAEASHAAGLVRLFAIALKGRVKCTFKAKSLSFAAAMFLKEMDYSVERITADVLEGAVREALVRNQPSVRDAAAFDARLAEGAADVARVEADISRILGDTLSCAAALHERLSNGGFCEETVESVSTQLAWLVYRGFPRLVPLARLAHYARYLKGIAVRLDRARTNPSGDRSKEARFAPYWTRYREALAEKDAAARPSAVALAEFRWMLEEYRISLFAPELKTSVPVSPKRLDAILGPSA